MDRRFMTRRGIGRTGAEPRFSRKDESLKTRAKVL